MKDRITQDMKAAMKAGDRLALETTRMLLAAIKNEEIEKRRELAAEETIAVLTRAVKTRHDAADLYEKGGRPELAEKERREIEIVRRYLPRPLEGDELAQAIDAIIREIGASTRKDIGRVMKELMTRHPGRVDGRTANPIVASRLAG